MRKSTLAIATLLTALSIAVITPAYADDSVQDPNTGGCSSCSGCNKSADEATAPATEDMNAQQPASSDTSS